MAAVALRRAKLQSSDQDIEAALTDLCRSGTYAHVRLAVHDAARPLQARKS